MWLKEPKFRRVLYKPMGQADVVLSSRSGGGQGAAAGAPPRPTGRGLLPSWAMESCSSRGSWLWQFRSPSRRPQVQAWGRHGSSRGTRRAARRAPEAAATLPAARAEERRHHRSSPAADEIHRREMGGKKVKSTGRTAGCRAAAQRGQAGSWGDTHGDREGPASTDGRAVPPPCRPPVTLTTRSSVAAARLGPASPSNTERRGASPCPTPLRRDPRFGCGTGRAKAASGLMTSMTSAR